MAWTSREFVLIKVFLVIIAFGGLLSRNRSFGILKTSVNDRPPERVRSSNVNHGCTNRSHFASTTGPRFLFVVGLEGTGHHLFMTIVKESPHMLRLRELGADTALNEVQSLLYSDNGLMNLHCADSRNRRKHSEQPAIPSVLQNCPSADTECLLREIVERLQWISLLSKGTNLTIPINANGYGMMMSYPNQGGACRYLQFPNLDFFFQACSEAGVECGTIYLYRDPYSVIKSTTVNRNYNAGPLQAMQLYTTMLNVIYSQFATSDKGIHGIFGFYDPNVSQADLWGAMYDMFGWTDKQEFANYIVELYKPPQPMSIDEKRLISPNEEELYMSQFLRAHENVLQLCRNQFEAKRDC